MQPTLTTPTPTTLSREQLDAAALAFAAAYDPSKPARTAFRNAGEDWVRGWVRFVAAGRRLNRSAQPELVKGCAAVAAFLATLRTAAAS